jgi:hypothetical protein
MSSGREAQAGAVLAAPKHRAADHPVHVPFAQIGPEAQHVQAARGMSLQQKNVPGSQ